MAIWPKGVTPPKKPKPKTAKTATSPGPVPGQASSSTIAAVKAISREIDKRKSPLPPEVGRRAWVFRAEKERRKDCKEIMRLRLCGCSNDEVSDTLGVNVETVVQVIAEGRRKGWITKDDDDRLENMVDPLTIDGVVDLLIKKDKDTILESAKGRGHFKSHQAIKNQTSQSTELRIRIEMEAPIEQKISTLPGSANVSAHRSLTAGAGSDGHPGDAGVVAPVSDVVDAEIVSYGVPRLDEDQLPETEVMNATDTNTPLP